MTNKQRKYIIDLLTKELEHCKGCIKVATVSDVGRVMFEMEAIIAAIKELSI